MNISEYANGYKNGISIECDKFVHEGKELDFGLLLFVCLQGPEEDLVFDITAREGGARVKECRWPKGFEAGSFDHTVVPYMQGMLLPKDWAEKVWLYNTMANGRGLYMPWWGHQQGKAAAMVIYETPDDAGCAFEHPAGGPTFIEPRWMHSMRALRYSRRARICFLREGELC